MAKSRSSSNEDLSGVSPVVEFQNAINNLINLSTPEISFEFLKEWTFKETTSDSELSEEVLRLYRFICEKGDIISVLKQQLMVELEIQLKNQSSLFRSNTLGIKLLSLHWQQAEGIKFNTTAIQPVIAKIGPIEHSLEINPDSASSGVDVKKNLPQLMNIVKTFLQEIIHSEEKNLISKELRAIFQSLNFVLSLRQSPANHLIAGVLFLRLICPVFAAPGRYGLDKEVKLSPHGRRALLLIASILQHMANLADGHQKERTATYLDACNVYLKPLFPPWRSFFHKFMTGEELRILGETTIASYTALDLIGFSNQDMRTSVAFKKEKEGLLTAQMDIVSKILAFESQTEGWKQKKNTKNYKLFYRYLDSNLIAKVEMDTNLLDVRQLYTFLYHNSHSKDLDPLMADFNLIEQYNDNLSMNYVRYKMPVITDRDAVFLKFCTMLPDNSFGLISIISSTHPSVPESKNLIRANVLAGYVIREREGGCSLHYIIHADIGGLAKYVPAALMRKTILGHGKHLEKVIEVAAKSKRATL